MEKLPTTIRAASSLVENPTKPATSHVSIFYTRAKVFLAELKDVLVDHSAEFSVEAIEFLNTPMFHTRTLSKPLLQMISDT